MPRKRKPDSTSPSAPSPSSNSSPVFSPELVSKIQRPDPEELSNFLADLTSPEELERERLRRKARLSPADLAEITSEGRWIRHPHAELINHHLLRASRGESRRLMVMMPPQHGKSTLTSLYFPAWMLGTHPDKRIILASYEADFARSWGRKVRDLLTEHGPNLFDVTIRQDTAAADDWNVDSPSVPTQLAGGMTTAGIGGPLTGRRADICIIDDPVKNSMEAMSETIQARNYEWYLTTALTRVSDRGIVVLIQTRWAVEDLAGKLLRDMNSIGEQWDIVSLPAIALQNESWPTGWDRPSGSPLCPQLFTLDTLEKRRSAMSDYLWSSLYQQSPIPLGGSVFKDSYFKRFKLSTKQPGYYEILDGLYSFDPWTLTRFVTIDSAMTEKEAGTKKADDPDYTVLGVWAVLPTPSGPILLLLDLKRGQWQTPEILDAMQEIKSKWRPAFIAIEAIGGGLALYQFAKRCGYSVRKISKGKADDVFLEVEGDKLARAFMAVPTMAEGRFFIPEVAPWIADYLAELLTFPMGAKKDQVDMTSYGCLIAEKFKTGFTRTDESSRPSRSEDDGYRRSGDNDSPTNPLAGWFAGT